MLRIVVLIKDIVDFSEVKIDPSTRKPKVEGIKRKISDLDKRALETAIRLKENLGGEVVTLSIGTSKTRTTVLEALAIGADTAYIVSEDSFKDIDSLATSKILHATLDKMGEFDLILCGEMALDSLSAQVGPRVSELLDIPLVTYAKKLYLENRKLIVERDLEYIDEIVEVDLPAVVSVVREINEPRIPSLMNIMKAKRKPTHILNAESIGVDIHNIIESSSIQTINVTAPVVERKKIVIKADTVEETAEKLAEAIVAEGFFEGGSR
jgi:electron transfer flavoprotein beta subunit